MERSRRIFLSKFKAGASNKGVKEVKTISEISQFYAVNPNLISMWKNDVHQVNWGALQHAYGIASDTPIHLQNLLSEDSDCRASALVALEDSICHQEYQIHESSLAALPFLFRLAEWPGIGQRAGIISLIANITNGNGAFQSIQQFEHFKEIYSAEEIAKNVRYEESLQHRIRDYVRSTKPVWIKFLQDEKYDVVESALPLISVVEETDDELFSVLLDCMPRLEPYDQIFALLALTKVGGISAISVLRKHLCSEAEEVRLAAIIGLLELNAPLDEDILDNLMLILEDHFTLHNKSWVEEHSIKPSYGGFLGILFRLFKVKNQMNLNSNNFVYSSIDSVQNSRLSPYPLSAYLCNELRKYYGKHADTLLENILNDVKNPIVVADIRIPYILLLAANPIDPAFVAGDLNPLQIRALSMIVGLPNSPENKKMKKQRMDRLRADFEYLKLPTTFEGMKQFVGKSDSNKNP